MRRWIAAGLCLGLTMSVAVLAAGEGKPDKAKARNFEVRMTNAKKFNPEEVEIQVGDTITWINESGAGHTATPDTKGDFEEQKVPAGKFSKRVTFAKEGTISYHCVPHKADGMKGKVVVKKAAP